VNILLPVDGSEFTQRTLDYIASHGALFGPGHTYTAFTAVAPIPAHAARYLSHAVVDEYYRDEAEKILSPLRESAKRHSLPIATKYAVGHAGEAIAIFAKAEQQDLIVMGSHGHSWIANVLLGSVATGVLARCNVPVLLVR
jgi:nucleotide-binding universal stress UspA family protein